MRRAEDVGRLPDQAGRLEQKKLTWGFGDVRCTVNVQAKRQELLDALGKPQFELKLATHSIRCEVEREKEVMPITVALSPRFQFKDGKAVKAWLGLGEIDGAGGPEGGDLDGSQAGGHLRHRALRSAQGDQPLRARALPKRAAAN